MYCIINVFFWSHVIFVIKSISQKDTELFFLCWFMEIPALYVRYKGFKGVLELFKTIFYNGKLSIGVVE